MQRIAISSQKGGVAKTTTCLSLGAALAEQGLQVLLVDLDPQAHLTQALGINPENLRCTIGDVLLFQSTLLEVSREGPLPDIDLVPADRGLILVEKLLHAAKGAGQPELRLRMALESLGDLYYDVILFDCPPSFGPLTINALAAAQMVIIPITCDFFALQSLQGYLRLLNLIRRNVNPQIVHRLLVTLYDGRTRLSKLVLDQYRRNFGPIMFKSIIPLDARLRESSLFGQPITQYATRARSAEDYRSLAQELWPLIVPNRDVKELPRCQKATT